MKKRKTPWGAIVVLVGIVAGISYTRMADLTPAVGTVEEMQAREEERMKKKAQEMAEKQPDALGTSRQAPSAAAVASVVRDTEKEQNLNELKRKKVGKAQIAMIMNPVKKITRDTVNESQPFRDFWREDSGRAKLGK